MAKSTASPKTTHGDDVSAAAKWLQREAAERTLPSAKPARRRRRANEITKIIGLTPITGLSGPKIAY